MIPALALFLFAVAYRLAVGLGLPGDAWLPNFTPVAALALCGPALVPRRFAVVLPLGALLVSDWLLNQRLGVGLSGLDWVARYGALLAIALAGLRLSGSRNLGGYVVGSIAGSVLFYLATNSAAWFGNPAYAQTVAGWVQALTFGIPGYPPTWTFFRSTLVGDLAFALLFLGLRLRMPVPAGSALPVPGRFGPR